MAAHALARLTARHVRLTRVGRQDGRDGATTPGLFDLFFGAKLYSGHLPRVEELQAKLMSVINNCHPRLDLWIPVATTAIAENSIGQLHKTGQQDSNLRIPFAAAALPQREGFELGKE